jgi:hypothetical protein
MRLSPSLRRLALLASALLIALAPSAHAVAISAPLSPNITTQPLSATLAPGKTATFTVKATGTAKLTYAWQISENAGQTYGPMTNEGQFSGVTTATLTVKSVSVASNINEAFNCVVTDGNKNTATSSPAFLNVVTPVAILAQPQATLTTLGGSANFTVTINNTSGVSFQWFKNTTAIANATASTFTINSAQTSDAATYYVVVTNPTGTVTSSKVKLTLGTIPVVSNPSSTGVVAGKNATFSVTATGTATLTYAWQVKSGGGFANLTNNTTIAGATTATLTVKSATQGMNGYQYECIVSNALGSDTSDPATLTVGTVPVISSPAMTASAVAGNSPTLMVTLSAGSGNVFFQWLKNGVAIDGKSGTVTSPTNITLLLDDVAAGDAGSYTVKVTNAVGNMTSKAITFTVTPAPGGIYFGTYSGTTGEKGKVAFVIDGENNIAVALHVSTSTTGTDGGNNTGGIIPTFNFDENGAFSTAEGTGTFNGTITGTSLSAIYFSPADPDDLADTVTITATPKLATGIQAANAGLYSGTFSGVNGQDQENTGGVTAILAADGTLLVVVSSASNNDGNNTGDNSDVKNSDGNNNNDNGDGDDQGGTGTVSASNAVSFTIFDGKGSGTGKLITNTDTPTITGNYTGGSNGSHGTFSLMLTTVGNFVDPDSGD